MARPPASKEPHLGPLILAAWILTSAVWLLLSGCRPSLKLLDPFEWKDQQRSVVQALALPGFLDTSCPEPSTAPSGHAPIPPPPITPDWVILTADHLEPTAARWAAYRRQWGHNTKVLTVSEVTAGRSMSSNEFIGKVRRRMAALRKKLSEDLPLYLLIMGTTPKSPRHIPSFLGLLLDRPMPTFEEGYRRDSLLFSLLIEDHTELESYPTVSSTSVPTMMWQEDFMTDVPFGDLDGDGMSEVLIGRVPASTLEQADRVLEKTIRYEQTRDWGAWRDRVVVFASEAGFGGWVDGLLESTGFEIARLIPDRWKVLFLHARKGSPYALPPSRYHRRLMETINQGALFALYVGHGYTDGLEDVRWGDEVGQILSSKSVCDFDCAARCPVMVLAACDAGRFGDGGGLAEKIILKGSSPPAVIAATDTSHPYPNAVLSSELAWHLLVHRPVTVGEAFSASMKSFVSDHKEKPKRLIDRLTEMVLPENDRKKLLGSHLRSYTLMGDPALRLPQPASNIEIMAKEHTVRPGGTLEVCGLVNGSPNGALTITLETERTVLAHPLLPWSDQNPKRDDLVETNWLRANDKVLFSRTIHSGGRFFFLLEIPEKIKPGKYVIRVQAHGRTGGSEAVSIEIEGGPLGGPLGWTSVLSVGPPSPIACHPIAP